MKNLLIDIGNSDIKAGICMSDKIHIKNFNRLRYSKSDFKKEAGHFIIKLFRDLKPNYTGISVLNSDQRDFLYELFRNKLNSEPIFINRNMKLPVDINYSKGLGNDRICSAAAAAGIYKRKNILIIDFGTATTYTLVSDKKLLGGLILPGIKTSLLSLTEKTSLPEVKLTFPKELINNNTADNIRAGVLYQSLYSAERIIKETGKAFRGLFVIATGGYSGLISRKTPLINITDRNLVLKGINILITK